MTPVLDVHPPHKPMHGAGEFFLHLFTITIGLLIALSLEGLVEWQHHRHLVHEAEASLRREIESNARSMEESLIDLHKQQAALKADIVVLRYIEKNHKAPKDGSMSVSFHLRTFNDVSWRTAQTTGAVAYMPYDRAQEYSDIYGEQAILATAEQQGARDAISSLSGLVNASDSDEEPTMGEAKAVEEKIGLLQGQMMLVDSLMTSLDKEYKSYLSQHPE